MKKLWIIRNIINLLHLFSQNWISARSRTRKNSRWSFIKQIWM